MLRGSGRPEVRAQTGRYCDNPLATDASMTKPGQRVIRSVASGVRRRIVGVLDRLERVPVARQEPDLTVQVDLQDRRPFDNA
jgi:hypothetical protein